MVYVLDSSVYISAKNLYYPFEVCPGFWEWILLANSQGKLFSPDRVRDELLRQQDELTGWVRGSGSTLFVPMDNASNGALRQVSEYLNSNFDVAQVANFCRGADYHLVAMGLGKGWTVVTQESRRQKVNIPEVCRGLGVKCMTVFEMLKREKPQFVLKR